MVQSVMHQLIGAPTYQGMDTWYLGYSLPYGSKDNGSIYC